MSLFWLKTLLAIFAVHFGIFSLLYLRKRNLQHLLAALTFALLVLSFSCRIWASEAIFLGHTVHTLLRSSAWLTSALVLIAFAKSKIARRSTVTKSPASSSPAEYRD
jgi:type II secretory pathway component PulF